MKFGFASFPDNHDFDDDAECQNFTDYLLGFVHLPTPSLNYCPDWYSVYDGLYAYLETVIAQT